ncbi:hypothetical protein [Paenibacillus durus]|uniref:Uncharacterized protein n=1 Tax=Paenibacillus durus TaxID=44251 RepID=A0A089HSP8_PAEDU|nr:hypothetical protein [Paenibacillus durus]AIQ13770.1 hypothetical protein PDUR_18990 [Paenibacillus durus]
MLSEQEILNNAFKDMLFHEQVLANKLAELHQEITEPQIQKLFQGMEMAARTRQNMLTQKMSGFGIV